MTEHTPKQLRSPSFPSIGLTEAVSKARIIWDKETRHPVPAEVAVTHWKYSPKSSGGRQAIASLLKYGLLEESGSNQARMVKLTDRALRILLGSGEEARAALRDAALAPGLHRLLWDTYQGTLPSDETLKRNLVLEQKFNPSSVPVALAAYKDSLTCAGLNEETSWSPSVEIPSPLEHLAPSIASPSVASDRTGGTLPLRPSSIKPAVPMFSIPSAEAYLPIPLDCGMNALIPRGMSEDDFSILLDTLKLWKRKIVRSE